MQQKKERHKNTTFGLLVPESPAGAREDDGTWHFYLLFSRDIISM